MEARKTKKKLKIFYIIFFTIFLILPLGIYVYFQYQLNSLEKETLNHLYNHGYRDIDLKEVDTTFQFGSRFVTKIIF